MPDTVVALDGASVVRATRGFSLTLRPCIIGGAPAAEFLRALMGNTWSNRSVCCCKWYVENWKET